MPIHSLRSKPAPWRPGTNGTKFPNGLAATAGSASLDRSRYTVRATPQDPWMRAVYVNVYASGGGGDGMEAGTGSTITVNAWFEYPSGNYIPMTYQGSANLSIASGAALITDPVFVGAPKGAVFPIWTYCTSAGKVPVSVLTAGTQMNSASGDGYQVATSGVPTTPGTVVDNASFRSSYTASAVLFRHREDAAALIGDSRTQGQGDTADTTIDVGNLARAIGADMPIVNMGSIGEHSHYFWGNSPIRRALADLCTCAVFELAFNDLNSGGGSAAGQEPYTKLALHMLSGKKLFTSAIEPRTTGTWTTAGGQTQFAGEAQRAIVNANRRAQLSMGVPYFDVSLAIEDPTPTPGKWNSTGATARTADGVHENALGYSEIKTALVAAPAIIRAATPRSYPRPSCDLTLTGASYGAAGMSGGKGSGLFAPPSYPFSFECRFTRSAVPVTNTEVMLGSLGLGWIGLTTAGFATSNCSAVATAITGAVNLCDGVEHHICLQHERTGAPGTKNSLFVDGVLIGSNTTNGTPETATKNAFAIGTQGGGAGTTDWLAGSIKNVALWWGKTYVTGFTPPTAFDGSEVGLFCAWPLTANSTAILGNLPGITKLVA